MVVRHISAITLAVRDMPRAVEFYRAALDLDASYGDSDASFTSFKIGAGYLNLVLAAQEAWSWWGRAIFHVDDVDAIYLRMVNAGLAPEAAPADAPWGERYFHITDPDGHELSFAKCLDNPA
ncbi:MAG: glyoxalase [SAR202 cluster bacterium Io17-Chloro-G2]|nr:MAG: glyoxalase [SAR202 cluster bacterium Io17-Chloro-G2]